MTLQIDKALEIKVFDLFKEVPKNVRVCIYGATVYGLFVKKLMEAQRPDLKLVYFVDTYKSGEAENTEIIKACDIKSRIGEFDYILLALANNGNYQVEVSLITQNIHNYISIDYNGLLVLKNHYEFFYKMTFPDENHKQYWLDNLHVIPEIQEMLETVEEKTLIKNLYEQRYDLDVYEKFQKYYCLKNINKNLNAYMDYINKGAIKVVIEGGIFDGGSSVLLLNKFPNIEKLYGFDIFGKDYLVEPYKSIINNSDKIEIIRKGLLDKCDKIKINNRADKYASNCFEGDNSVDEDSFYLADTITIEQFAIDKKIKVDFIKMDIEGSELPALKGAEALIKSHRPQMAICIYHTQRVQGDLFEIPLYLKKTLKDYVFRLEHYSSGNVETILYCIPKELYKA